MAKKKAGEKPLAIEGELTTRIGKWVRFKPPDDVAKAGGTDLRGQIIDEVWADPELNKSEPSSDVHLWGDHSFFAQLIRIENGDHLVRLGFYRRRKGTNLWQFAGQTTISTVPATAKKLMDVPGQEELVPYTPEARAKKVSTGRSKIDLGLPRLRDVQMTI